MRNQPNATQNQRPGSEEFNLLSQLSAIALRRAEIVALEARLWHEIGELLTGAAKHTQAPSRMTDLPATDHGESDAPEVMTSAESAAGSDSRDRDSASGKAQRGKFPKYS